MKDELARLRAVQCICLRSPYDPDRARAGEPGQHHATPCPLYRPRYRADPFTECGEFLRLVRGTLKRRRLEGQDSWRYR